MSAQAARAPLTQRRKGAKAQWSKLCPDRIEDLPLCIRHFLMAGTETEAKTRLLGMSFGDLKIAKAWADSGHESVTADERTLIIEEIKKREALQL